jgi:hypothetical protein
MEMEQRREEEATKWSKSILDQREHLPPLEALYERIPICRLESTLRYILLRILTL